MRRKLVAGNWKMNGDRKSAAALLAEVTHAADSFNGIDIVVCPPFTLLGEASRALTGSGGWLGAQDLSEHENGAHTGEVSGAMLADSGCRFVIVGHSERRKSLGETDAQVARKFVAARHHGLVPILCVGESLEERESGSTEEVVLRQVRAVLDVVGDGVFDGVIAYEPVWAIGSGRTATPEQAQEVHALIREKISTQNATMAPALRILYGGSVKASNAASLFGMPDIDGGLIGGASLDGDEFFNICQAADQAK